MDKYGVEVDDTHRSCPKCGSTLESSGLCAKCGSEPLERIKKEDTGEQSAKTD